MNDRGVLGEIEHLADEERDLLHRAEGHRLSATEQERLHAVEIHLDQCWDLLRQRRGRRHAGMDADDAQVRDATTVERYQQ